MKSRRARQLFDRALGIAGEGLITAGVMIGLFVGWELWWTDVAANQAQAEIVDELAWENADPPTAVKIAPVFDDQGPVVDTTYPVIPTRLMHRTAPPPAMNEPAHATTFATMYAPRWGYDYIRPISQGTTKRDVLDALGIGHYNGTAMPGGWGNFAMAAHRMTYGKPFSRIDELAIGDPIVVRTEEVWYVYRVTSAHIVAPTAVEVLAPVPNHPDEAADGRYLTLTTCHPQYSARERYVVHAELDYWAPSSAGYPPELIPPSAETTAMPSRAPSPSLVSASTSIRVA